MARTHRSRASRAEYEQRLVKLAELLATRAPQRSLVRYARESWGLGERAAQAYVAEARARLAENISADYRLERGLAAASYEYLFRKQLAAGDLRNARATLDKQVALLGLAVPPRQQPLTLETIGAEIARLEAAIGELEGRTP